MNDFALFRASGLIAAFDSGDDIFSAILAFLRNTLPGLPLPDDLKYFSIISARFETKKSSTIAVSNPKNPANPPQFVKTKPHSYLEVIMLPQEVNDELTKFAQTYLACRFTILFLEYIRNPNNKVLPVIGMTAQSQEKLLYYRDNPAMMTFLDFRLKDAEKLCGEELLVNSFKPGLLAYQLNPNEAAGFIRDTKSKCDTKLKNFFQKMKGEILRLSGYKEYNPLDDMKASENAYDLIRKYEKFIPKLYSNDGGGGGGNCTIGYGHLIHERACRKEDFATYPNGISQLDAEAFLRSDVEIAENVIKRSIKVELTQNQFDALVSFVFTLGRLSRDMIDSLNSRNFDAASANMRNFTNSNGKFAPGLVPRRDEESQLFSTH